MIEVRPCPAEAAAAMLESLAADPGNAKLRAETVCRLLSVLDYPMLLASPGVAPALATIRGPVGDAAAALNRHLVAGQIDVESFLRDCPAGLCGVAVESFAMPAGTRRFPLASDQVADVLALLAEIGAG